MKMKRIISLLLCTVFIINLLTVPALALESPPTSEKFDTLAIGVGNTFVADGIQYNVLSELDITGTVEVDFNNISHYKGNVTIPPTVTYSSVTYTVTGIGDRAFFQCSDLTGVTIPNNVERIGKFAFSECSNLTSVTIPDSVKSIGIAAFQNCGGLKNLTISNGITSIDEHVFYGCNGLTDVTIPDEVISIGKFAFSRCRGLKNIKIPEGVTDIGESAFSVCTNLISITIPDSVTSIGKSAFDVCSSLTSVSIPDKITIIEENTFWSCSNLYSLTIPDGVKIIGKNAFFQCSALTVVTIPGSVTNIDDSAFSGCRKLTNAYFKGSPPTTIGTGVFNDTISEFKIYYDYSTSGWTNPWNGYSTAAEGTVTFDSLGGSIVANKITEIGTKVAEPDEPIRKGSYEFGGWYKETTCENPWIFDADNFTENITLYAKWNNFIDTVAPAVLGISPLGTDAFTRGNIVITFNEPMDTTTAGMVTVNDENLKDGSWSSDARTYTVQYSGLNFDTEYLVAILGFKDDAGNIMVDDNTHSFKTMEATEVTVNITGHRTGYLDIEIDEYMESHSISDYASITALRVSGGEIHTLDKSALYNKSLLGSGGSLKIVDFSGTAFIDNEITSYMFGQSTTVKNIILPESVSTIQTRAFSNCTSLKNINLPSDLAMIDYYAFAGCSALTDFYTSSVKPPTKVHPNAFAEVGAGAAIHVPPVSESYWDAVDFMDSDWKCWSLLIEPHPPTLDIWSERLSDSTAEVVVQSSEPGLCYYKVVKAGETIPVIDTLGAGEAFSSWNGLNIELDGLDSGVYNIYVKAKDLRGNISNLSTATIEVFVDPVDVTISNHMSGELYNEIDTYLDSMGLAGKYEKIKSLMVKGGSLDNDDFDSINYLAYTTRFFNLSGTFAANIPKYTFGDSPIEYVSSPLGLESIGDYAFENCRNLIAVTIPSSTPPTVGEDAFYGIPSTAIVYVPTGSVANYRAIDDSNTSDNLWYGLDIRTVSEDKTLVSITSPSAITGVANGTPKTASSLGLPSTLTLITDGGNVGASVMWDVASSSYNPSASNEQTFTVDGIVALPSGVVNTKGISLDVAVSVTVVAATTSDKILLSITTPSAITGIANGTPKTSEALGLPSTLTLVTDGGNVSASVMWDVTSSSYNPFASKEQTFTVYGALMLPNGVINANNVLLSVSISVTVKAASSGSTGGGSNNNQPKNNAKSYKADIRVNDSVGNSMKETLPVTVDENEGIAFIDVSSHGKLKSGGETTDITVPSIPNINTYIFSNLVSYLSTPDRQGTLTVNTDIGSVTIPSNMLTGASGTNGNRAEISISRVDKSILAEAAKVAVGDRPLIQLSLSIDGKQVEWNNPEVPVKVSIPYTPTDEERANSESIIIWYIDSSGRLSSIPNGHYDLFSGTVTFFATHFSYYAIGFNKVSFNDVAADEWYSKSVGFIAARGITNGSGNGNYSPDAKLTRSEFLVLLMKAYDISQDENYSDNFTDSGNNYYTNYLSAAKRLGITAGVGNNMFYPDNEITRQEMFTLLYNVLKIIHRLPDGKSEILLTDFSDSGEIESWAKDAMMLLVETGTIGGGAGKLSPTNTTTRAEMAQVLYNLLSK